MNDNNNIEVIKETVWTVYDPWIAQDVATFTSKEEAKRFAKRYARRR